jgi:hypothetical protein
VPDDIYFIGMKIWCCISDLPREIKKPSWLLIIIELGFEICNLGFVIQDLRIRIYGRKLNTKIPTLFLGLTTNYLTTEY